MHQLKASQQDLKEGTAGAQPGDGFIKTRDALQGGKASPSIKPELSRAWGHHSAPPAPTNLSAAVDAPSFFSYLSWAGRTDCSPPPSIRLQRWWSPPDAFSRPTPKSPFGAVHCDLPEMPSLQLSRPHCSLRDSAIPDGLSQVGLGGGGQSNEKMVRVGSCGRKNCDVGSHIGDQPRG